MQRVHLENAIKDFIIKHKHVKLAVLLEKSIRSFSDNDLEKIVSFIASGDQKLLLDLMTEKTKKLSGDVQAIKSAKGKIVIGKSRKIEREERKQEQKILEKILDQL